MKRSIDSTIKNNTGFDAKKVTIALAIAVVFVFCPDTLASFYNGSINNIDYTINAPVYVGDSSHGEPTTVNLLPGGYMAGILSADEHSIINVLGGEIEWQLFAHDYTQVKVQSGTISFLYTYDNSYAEISGGSILREIGSHGNSNVILTGGSADNLVSWNNSLIRVFGGSLGYRIDTYDDSRIIIYGSDFMLDGVSINYGLIPSDEEYLGSILAGTLMDGHTINCEIYIDDNSSVLLIPEPATILLLGLGGLAVRKKRKA